MEPRAAHKIQGEATPKLNVVGASLLLTVWLVMLCFMHPFNMAHPLGCQGTLLAMLLSAELLSRHSSPSLCLCLAFLCPRCSSWHFPLLNFMSLLMAQCSDLSRSLRKASHPCREPTAPPSLESSANLLRMHFTPATRPLIKMLSRTSPRIEP